MNSDQSDLPIRVIERSLGPDSVINDDSRYSVDGRPIPVAVRPKNIDDLSAILTESHAQDVSSNPVLGTDISVNSTTSGGIPTVGVPEKSAVITTGSITLI